MKSKKFYFALLALLFLMACSNNEKADNKKDKNKADTTQTALQKVQDVNKVVGIGLIVPESLISKLSVQLPGVVTEIDKQIGDKVKAGDVILKLDDRDEQLALEQYQQQLITKQFQVKLDKAAIEQTKVNLSNKQDKLKSTRYLQEQGAETREALDDLQASVESLQAELQQKEAQRDVTQSELNGIRVNIDKAKNDIEKKTVRAPSDGEILQISAVQDSYVVQNDPVVSFAPKGPVIARCEIDEMFAGQVKLGQKAEIRKIGFRKVIANGKVVLMSPYLSEKSLLTDSPTEQQDRRVREVRIEISDPGDLLFNSRVECTILTSENNPS